MKVSFRKSRGKKGSRYLVRCDDCKARLEIYPPDFNDPEDELLEIGGVIGKVEEWRRLLLPMLDDPRWFRRMLKRRIKEADEGKTIPAHEVFARLARELRAKAKRAQVRSKRIRKTS